MKELEEEIRLYFYPLQKPFNTKEVFSNNDFQYNFKMS
jgi:hypothetical protein